MNRTRLRIVSARGVTSAQRPTVAMTAAMSTNAMPNVVSTGTTCQYMYPPRKEMCCHGNTGLKEQPLRVNDLMNW